MTGPHLGTEFYFTLEKSSTWYLVRLDPDHEGQYYEWQSDAHYAIISFEKISKDSPISSAVLGIIESTDDENCITVTPVSLAKVEVPEQGLLKKLKSTAAPYLKGIKTFKEGKEKLKLFKSIYPIRGERLGSKQKWCVM